MTRTMRQVFLGVLLASLGFATLMGILVVLGGMRSESAGRVALTALTIGFTSLGGFVSAMLLDKRRFLLAGWAGMVAAGAAGLLCFIMIWWGEEISRTLSPGGGYPREQWIFQLLGTAIAVGVGLPLIAALLTPRLTKFAQGIQFITVGVILLAMLSGCVLIWTAGDRGTSESLAKTWGVLAILSLAGSIATSALARSSGNKSDDELVEAATKLTIFCPRCLTKQDLPVGDSACIHCRLKFKIEVEEPRCGKCGYILRGLTRPICPECGETL